MLTIEAADGGDQAQQEQQGSGSQWDPDQEAAGTCNGGQSKELPLQLSTAALSYPGGGARGEEGGKQILFLGGHVHVGEAMIITPEYPLRMH